jgi:N-acyl-L-homoserine lactone synthetase
MIHIITSENRHLYGLQLRAMREQRVETNGWVDLAASDGGEIDDQDNARAIYLLGFDDALRLEVGLRLRPTDDGCGLADTFPHLIAPGEPPKTGRDVWEVSRLFTTEICRKRNGPKSGERVLEAWAAAMALALAGGVTRFVGVIDMRLYPEILNSPIDIRLIGLPRLSEHGVVAGSEIALSRALLDRVLEAIGKEAPVGYHVDAMDMMAFGDLAAVQRQVIRAMTPQLSAGAERDETLAAETLFRLHDTASQAPRIWAKRDGERPGTMHA